MYWTLIIPLDLLVFLPPLWIDLEFFLYFCCDIWAGNNLSFSVLSAAKCQLMSQWIRPFGDNVVDLTAGSKGEMNLQILRPPCTDVLVNCLFHTKMEVRQIVTPVAAHDSGQSKVHKNRTASSTTAEAVIVKSVKFSRQMVQERHADA